MNNHRPPIALVWKAIDLYLSQAYLNTLPSVVQARLQTLRSLAEDEFYNSPMFERDPASAGRKLSLRLGNRFYPHMKLILEKRPDQQGFIFRADAHDRHCQPAPTSREYATFCKLMEQNQQVVQQIESAWAENGIPTFKTFLREDLARRHSAASAAGVDSNPQ